MNAARRPVFVLGTASSGSSILSWALAQHPRMGYALETTWVPALARVARDLEVKHGDRGGGPGSPRTVVPEPARARFSEAFGTAINDLLLTCTTTAGSPRRWVDCTPDHVSSVAGLVRLFPHAKFIHVVRDVRSVVRALVGRSAPDGTTYDEESAFEYWLRTSKAILEAELAFGTEKVLRVPYDDLLHTPERTLRRCLRFVGERFCADCLRPFNGLAAAGGEASDTAASGLGDSPTRYEAELLSGLLLSHTAPRHEWMARLDHAFGTPAVREKPADTRMTLIRRSADAVRRGSSSLLERVRRAAAVLPPDASVLVISKGDDELLKLDGRRAAHFPQESDGTYAGFHPAESRDAIAHLEQLRARGYGYLLIPGPHFWWLEYYRGLTKHLHAKYRVVYYQEDTCLIFRLDRTARGWAADLSADDSPPADVQTDHTPSTAPAPRRPFRAEFRANPAHAAQKRLWGGFSSQARAELDALRRSETAHTQDRISAAWELARWHAFQDGVGATLPFLRQIAALDPAQRLAKPHLILEVRALLALGRMKEARALVAQGVKKYGYDTDICLLSSNVLIDETKGAETALDTDEARLALINRIYAERRLLPIAKTDPDGPLTIANIRSDVPISAVREDGPRVSVIVPVHNAAKTIEFALAGLRHQTWRNIEILVVDDASTDETTDIVSAVAARDARIRLLTTGANSGTYVARNKGLEQATGEFITVHDADDWSHPQKIETQLAYLQTHDGAVACLSRWVRAAWNLRFTGNWRPCGEILEDNYSSLMLRTDLIRELGGWDPVRIGADVEFRRRLEKKYGKARVPIIFGDTPWSIALDEEQSLTRRKPTHVSTLHFGLRQAYRWAYERWHNAAAATGDFRVSPDPSAPRRFPAPAPVLSARAPARHYDVLFVGDFALNGGAFVSPYNCILAALRDGRRVGVFHWRRYDLDISRKIDQRLARLLDDFRVDIVVADQEVTAQDVVLYYPLLFKHRVDRVPALSFERMHVIVNQMADRLYSGGDPQYDPQVVSENLRSLFGSTGEWCPISPLVRELMMKDPRYPRPGDATWTPLLDTDLWCREPIRWRGARQPAPVIGRHGRDHYTKWPETREALEQAYCVNRRWETRFLGGADCAIRTLGTRPSHWSVWRYDALDTREFLHGLDFLVHVPHEDYIEEFGRVAMEAMAVGIPVIVPPRFRSTFGDAAVYCEPREVADRIEHLWTDEARYLAQAQAGRRFVLANCSLDQLSPRLGPRRRADATGEPQPLERGSWPT